MKKVFITLLLSLLSLNSFAQSEKKIKIENIIKKLVFDFSTNYVYKIENFTQSLDQSEKDYQYYTYYNYTTKNHKLAKNSLKEWKKYIKRRKNEDTLIYDAFRKGYFNDPAFLYFIRVGLRRSIIKGYLFKQIPDMLKIKDAHLIDNHNFFEKIYQKNKYLYDQKQISKKNAINALRKVFLEKKKKLLIKIILRKKKEIYNQLMKELKIEVKKVVHKKIVKNP